MNLTLKKIIGAVVLGFVLFSSANQTLFAQEFKLYSEKDISVETYPAIPGPNELVELKLKSYSFNLNNYFITWYLNGKKQSADYGNRSLSFRTGDIGIATNVTAVIDYEDQVFRKELRFVPAEVDLLWEAVDAYTPPFYKGKALPMQQADIKITAIPETQLLAPKDADKLIYYWDRNYKRIIPKSGFGKNSFRFEADPLLVADSIRVAVNDRRENSFAENKISLNTKDTDPQILFYEINEDGRVMTNRALNEGASFEGDEARLGFYPLNLSSTEENFTDLFVGWKINGKDEAPQDFDRQNELHLTTGGVKGIVDIGLDLESIDKLLQKASETFKISFQAKRI